MEPAGFREVARSATTSYPIPFVVALCLAFAALVLGAALFAHGPLIWVMVGFAAASTAFAFVVFGWAALCRPELLRSERVELAHRVLDLVGDSDLTPNTIDEIGRLVSGEPRSKRPRSSRQ